MPAVSVQRGKMKEKVTRREREGEKEREREEKETKVESKLMVRLNHEAT